MFREKSNEMESRHYLSVIDVLTHNGVSDVLNLVTLRNYLKTLSFADKPSVDLN